MQSNHDNSPARLLSLRMLWCTGGRGLVYSVPSHPGGKGAYTSGIIDLKETRNFFLFIGGTGQDGIIAHDVNAAGGFNGGGLGGKDLYKWEPTDTPGGGGGATDIRLIGGEYNNSDSLASRIMVAAGGSGASYDVHGAPGGGLNGFQPTASNSEKFIESQTSQNSGNALGEGAHGEDCSYIPSSGGGGGYYGGNKGEIVTSDSSPYYKAVASSGSSYVAGYPDCPPFTDALGESFAFHSPIIRNGISLFPAPDHETSNKNEVGHSGNGLIKITLLFREEKHYCEKISLPCSSIMFIILSSMK